MRNLFACVLPLALAACAAGPDYTAPSLPPPALGPFQTPAPATSAAQPARHWWKLYDDPVLDRLIERALIANTDVRVALANLERARAALREIRAERGPGGELSGGARFGNEQGGNRGGDGATGQGGGSSQWSTSGAATIGWEVDLFGRISRSIEAGRADAQALEAARDGVALAVVAETARSYADACALAEAIDAARQSVAIADRQHALQAIREEAGAGTGLDRERAATELANARAAVPALEGRRQAALFELAALLGEAPSGIPAEAAACAKIPRPTAAIPVGDGRGLLARRPDVRQAERRLAAETARIGVATAELYPSISLGGSGNFFRDDTTRGGDSFSFSLGPLISWNWGALFAGRAHVEQAQASARAALAQFDGTVLTALKEAEQALALYAAEMRRNQRLVQALAHASAAHELALHRYRAGASSFLETLDAQRQLVLARSTLADSNRELGSRRIDLFKALGSGWQIAPDREAGEGRPAD